MGKFLAIFLLFFLVQCKRVALHYPEYNSPLRSAENFRLTDQNGKMFDFFEEIKNKKITILFFGYSHCPDICISVLEKLTNVYRRLNNSEKFKVSFIFISIDPSRDNTKNLKKYGEKYDPNLILLSGDLDSLTRIKSNYKIVAERSESLDSRRSEGALIHSTNLLWINSKKEILRSIPHQFHPNDLLEEIEHTLNQE
jgi:protein SCO1/2